MNTLSITLLGTVLALIFVFFAMPIVAGGNMNVCRDVEGNGVQSAAATITGSDSEPMYKVVNATGQAGARGYVERQKEVSAHPYMPSVLSCTVTFWQSL